MHRRAFLAASVAAAAIPNAAWASVDMVALSVEAIGNGQSSREKECYCMPPESPRVAEARPWFTKAAHDLQAAELLLTADPSLLGEVAFHCQQAAEKAMKGYLRSRNKIN